MSSGGSCREIGASRRRRSNSRSRCSAGRPQKSSDPKSASGEPALCEIATGRLYPAEVVAGHGCLASGTSYGRRLIGFSCRARSLGPWLVVVPRVGKRSVRRFSCAPTQTVPRRYGRRWAPSWRRSTGRSNGWAPRRRSPSPRAPYGSRWRPPWWPEPGTGCPRRGGQRCPRASAASLTSAPPLRRWPPIAPLRWASRSAAKRRWWPSGATSRPAVVPRPGWWTVRALGPARAFADWTVSLRCGGVATSSLESRMPALADDAWLAASVAAGSCVEAKVAAAAVLGLGLQAPGWLDEHRLAARLVARDGTVITLGGWPDAPVRTRRIPGSPW